MKLRTVVRILGESNLDPNVLAKLIDRLVIQDTEDKTNKLRKAGEKKSRQLALKYNALWHLEEYLDSQRMRELELTREFPEVSY